MEIYHRDHWAIIVHMAQWYDLIKGTEENTSIDWISHIGRILKRVLPMTPAFTPLALRLWLHKIYFQASEPRVPWRGAHQIHLVNLGYYWQFLVRLCQSWSVLVSLVQSWLVLVTLGPSWSVLVRLGQSWSVWICLGQSWSLLVSFG